VEKKDWRGLRSHNIFRLCTTGGKVYFIEIRAEGGNAGASE